MAAWRADEGGLTLSVHVTPRASRDAVLAPQEDWLPVKLRAPPVDGEANAALVKFFAKALKIPRGDIALLSGETARLKRIRLVGDPHQLAQALQNLYRPSA